MVKYFLDDPIVSALASQRQNIVTFENNRLDFKSFWQMNEEN